MEKSQAEALCKEILNKRKEGITDFILHRFIRIDLNKGVIIAEISYTWYLNGHPKPVKKMECFFLGRMGSGKHAETFKLFYMLTLKQITEAIPSRRRKSYSMKTNGNHVLKDKKRYKYTYLDKLIKDEAMRYLDIIHLIKEIMGMQPLVHILDISKDIIIEYRWGEFKINICGYPQIVVDEIMSMIRLQLPTDKEILLRTMLRYVPDHYLAYNVKNVAVHIFARQEFLRVKNIMRQYYITGEEKEDTCSPFDDIEDAFISTIHSRLKTPTGPSSSSLT